MNEVFYIAAVVALATTLLAVTRRSAVHALLYLIVSLLAIATIFLVLGAAFAAMLEAIVYAGAILVLFVFVIMMLNVGQHGSPPEASLKSRRAWLGPAVAAGTLLAELVYAMLRYGNAAWSSENITPQQVGISLYGPYLLGVELASMLLLAGLVGAYHLGRRSEPTSRPTGGRP
jgi:NADH-quinone oxidoreductase subunit J